MVNNPAMTGTNTNGVDPCADDPDSAPAGCRGGVGAKRMHFNGERLNGEDDKTLKTRHTTLLGVEPVAVELDRDGSLLFSSLQAAFPGASALYRYQSASDASSNVESKRSQQRKMYVKFDGRRFHLPSTNGTNGPYNSDNSSEYFVQLNVCPNAARTDRFSHASKQFERSVQLVQHMMDSIGDSPTQASSPSITTQPTKLSPLEHQFADLSQIIQGKDVIIEKQREELQKLISELESASEKVKLLEEGDLAELGSRCSLQEQELEMFRSMSREQTSMSDEVRRVTGRLREVERLCDERVDEMGAKLRDKEATISGLEKEKTKLAEEKAEEQRRQ